jgi:hypothetical protein
MHHRWLPWLASKQSTRTPSVPKEGSHAKP